MASCDITGFAVRILPWVINSRRVAVILPAYNAEATLSRTVAELDREIIDELVLVDDASTDRTVQLGRELGLGPDQSRGQPRLRGQPEDVLPAGA